MKKLAFLLALVVGASSIFAADAANDVLLNQRNSANDDNVQRNVTATANSLFAFDASLVPTATAAPILASVQANASGGLLLKNFSGTTVMTVGPGSGTGVAFAGGLTGITTVAASGVFTLSNSTASTSTTTGSLINAGGFGNAGAAYFGGAVNMALSNTIGAGTNVFRLTDGGGDITAPFMSSSSPTTNAAFIYSDGSEASIGLANYNGTRQISVVSIGTANTVDTPGAETANLVIKTKPAGSSAVTALTISGATQASTFAAPVILKNYTVATLPAAASYTYGEAYVSDATQAAGTSMGSAPTGGGSVVRGVYSNGAAWLLR